MKKSFEEIIINDIFDKYKLLLMKYTLVCAAQRLKNTALNGKPHHTVIPSKLI